MTKKRAKSQKVGQKDGQFYPNARFNGHARLKTNDFGTQAPGSQMASDVALINEEVWGF